jgi:superfamily II DNA or RNA helicase
MIPSKSNNKLRDYQIEYKNKIYEEWIQHRSVMLQMPTGTGKTVLFASIVRDIHEHGASLGRAFKALILVHREELVNQASETLYSKYNVAHGVIMAGALTQAFYPTQIASVQTLARRLHLWKEKGFDFIIIDEAHHALAESYKRICQTFENAKILGVTATPYRMSGESFSSMFEKLISSKKVSDFIDEGYLSKYEYYSIAPTSAMQQIIDKIDSYDIDGDYAIAAMSKALDNQHVQSRILDSYTKYANGKKGIVYTINKSHNEHVCQMFQNAGFSAKAIDSGTPKGQRAQAISDFKGGKIKILCNVNIFSEGFDCPDVEFVQLARPTTSLSLYLQQVGRGLRAHDSIEKVIFLDNVGSYNKFGLPSSYRNWDRYFRGHNQKVNHREDASSTHTSTKIFDIDTGEIFIEGNKKVELIYATNTDVANEIATSSYELTDFEHFEDFLVPEKVENGELHDYFLFQFDYELWASELIENGEIEDDEVGDNIVDGNRLLGEKKGSLLKKVMLRNKWGIYDAESKKMILDIEYDEIRGANVFGKCVIKKDSYYGIYCTHRHHIALKCEYDDIDFIRSMSRMNQCIASKNGLYGIVSVEKAIIVPFKYDDILLFKRTFFDFECNNLFAQSNGKWIVIDAQNNVTKHFQIVDQKNGNCIVTYDGFFGFGTAGGEAVFPIIFKKIEHFHEIYIAELIHGGKLIFKRDMNLLFQSQFSHLKALSPDVIIARNSEKGTGIIDFKGNVILDFTYDDIKIQEGIIGVYQDKMWHIIDLEKNVYTTAAKSKEALEVFKASEIYRSKKYIGISVAQPKKAKGAQASSENKIIENKDHASRTKNEKASIGQAENKSIDPEALESKAKELEKMLERYFEPMSPPKQRKNREINSNEPNIEEKTSKRNETERRRRPRIKRPRI